MVNKDLLNVVVSGKGPNLVLVHGVAGSYRIWDKITPILEKKFTVIRVDLLGYGHSPKPRIKYTPKVQVDTIRSTLIEKNISPPYNLVGLSMGVNLVLEFASLWPDEVVGFIAVGMPYYPNQAEARRGLQNNVWTRLTLNRPLLAQIFIPTVWWLGRHRFLRADKFSSIYSPAMAKDTLLNPYYAFKSSLINCMVNNRQDDLLKATGSINRLFIHGSADQWCSPKTIKKAIEFYPKSKLEIIDGVAHNTVVIAPEQTAQLILKYL